MIQQSFGGLFYPLIWGQKLPICTTYHTFLKKDALRMLRIYIRLIQVRWANVPYQLSTYYAIVVVFWYNFFDFRVFVVLTLLLLSNFKNYANISKISTFTITRNNCTIKRELCRSYLCYGVISKTFPCNSNYFIDRSI